MSYCWHCNKDVDENPYCQGTLFEDDDAFIWYCESCTEKDKPNWEKILLLPIRTAYEINEKFKKMTKEIP